MTPREHALRGSQVSFSMPDGDVGYAVMQALIAHGVIGDFRAPDILRFGFAPSYLRYVDVWDAVRADARGAGHARVATRPKFRARRR